MGIFNTIIINVKIWRKPITPYHQFLYVASLTKINTLNSQRVGLQAIFNRAEPVKFKADTSGIVIMNVILKNALQLVNIVEFTGVEAF